VSLENAHYFILLEQMHCGSLQERNKHSCIRNMYMLIFHVAVINFPSGFMHQIMMSLHLLSSQDDKWKKSLQVSYQAVLVLAVLY